MAGAAAWCCSALHLESVGVKVVEETEERREAGLDRGGVVVKGGGEDGHHFDGWLW